MKKKTLLGLALFTTILALILVAGIFVADYFKTVINVALNADTQKVVADEGAQIFYWSDYDTEEELLANDMAVGYQVEAEGATLLINKDNTLPLPADTKFSLFSQSSVSPVLVGTGSADMSTGDAVSFYSALEDSFQEGCVNTDLWKFYVTSGYKRVNAKLAGGSPEQYRINEVPWDKLSDNLKATFSSYGDVALVVLSRSSGEGADLPSGLESLTEYMTDGDYLQLCAEEKELLANLTALKAEGVFKKIVVLLNSSSTLQLDFVDEYDIDALLWVGNLGLNGIPAVTDILAGKVNPSGRLVDTFLKDNHASPAMQNYDAFAYTNAEELELGYAQNNGGAGIEKCNQNYVVYQEGIYVGYRYFETRYEDYVLNQGNAGEYDYEAEVAFPFGYGLSYSAFAYSDFSIEEQDTTIEVAVTVTNVGSVDGKHTVQIYFQSPYTQYDMDNGVEKASVELCGFEKVELQQGESKKVTISVLKDDLTSYDSNGAKTYIMDAGDYYFTVGTHAHNAINNILLAKGADPSRMSGTGDAALTAKWVLDELDTTTYSVSAYTGNEITNLFDNADLNKYEGAEGQTVTYLTRSNWVGTFPTPQVLYVTDQMWADGLTHEESGRAAIAEKMKEAYWSDAEPAPERVTGGTLRAIDFVDVDYDDPSWDSLIAQVSYEDMKNFITNGFHSTQTLSAINLPATREDNGPTGFTKSLTGGGNGMAFPSEDVMAATYNRTLIQAVGQAMAEDVLHGNQGETNTAIAGLYAPGANIHRTQYLGRHNEYYSEDGWLSGEICAAEVQGIRSKGVLAFVKHFALNDQEEGRYGVSVWANEQSIREVYLEAFEGAIRGGAMNVMSSFNRIGVVWAGGHHGLMTGILRDEWGMEGSAVTDCSNSAAYMDHRLGLLAGQDMWTGYSGGMETLPDLEDDPILAAAAQQATKHSVYSITRTNAMNIGNAEIIPITPWWVWVLHGLTLALCLAAMTLWCLYGNKRRQSV